MGLAEVHFNAIAENLVNILKDLKLSQELIDQVVVALTIKEDVLGRRKTAKQSGSASCHRRVRQAKGILDEIHLRLLAVDEQDFGDVEADQDTWMTEQA